jgi:arsenate reductase
VTENQWMKEARELAALRPKKLLFMCVHNSARSQLAEAIARHCAPAGVTVISAGSHPAFVRPQVLQALEEAGISTKGLYSKAVDDIDVSGVEAVITLCAEEVCPVYLGKAHRLHWGLPDPAKVEPEDKKLEAFRQTRDELMKRLKHAFNYVLD